MTHVSISSLTKRFGGSEGTVAVNSVDLEIQSSELVVLLGPSGCGKTTLLRCIAGLERPTEGRIEIGGERIFDHESGSETPPHKRDIGMVFQNYALWPNMNVRENVAYPLRHRKVGRAERAERAMSALDMVECGALWERSPSEMSGGQQQRVALARALVARPSLILFDEPLSNLDFRLRLQLRYELHALHAELGFTGVYVTHDQTEALQLGSRIAVMRAGTIEQVGTPLEVFQTPATSYVAEFLGIDNRFEVRRIPDGWESSIGTLDAMPTGLPAHDTAFDVFVRASDVELVARAEIGHAADGSRSDLVRLAGGVVKDVLYGGETSDWVVEFNRQTVLTATRRTDAWPFIRGDRVDVAFEARRALVFSQTSGETLVDTFFGDGPVEAAPTTESQGSPKDQSDVAVEAT